MTPPRRGTSALDRIDVDEVVSIARAAGRAIMSVYQAPFDVQIKDDASPLTAADRAAHEIIETSLRRAYPDIPLLSEEGPQVPFDERRRWTRFWLVDPLDGTKEFVQRNGEFTVNIALVEGQAPVLGVIGLPTRDRTYRGDRHRGAAVQDGSGSPVRIAVRAHDLTGGRRVVVSRSHRSAATDALLARLDVAETIACGGSSKFCAIAEGRADLYPRLGPTMEWDTAAGQAIVEAAGGAVLDLSGHPIVYNKPILTNPPFVVEAQRAPSCLS